MNVKRHEIYFLLGLLFYIIGQFLIFVFFADLDALHSQEPIDFAHWFMIVGALLLIPQVGNFPKSKLNLIAVPLLIAGIGLVIGMCTLDFVFWSIEDPDFKSEVATHLIGTPEIWKPFMVYNGWIFNLGLLLCSLNYYKISKIGILVVAIGTLVIVLGGGWLNVAGYVVLTVGFFMIFLANSRSSDF